MQNASRSMLGAAAAMLSLGDTFAHAADSTRHFTYLAEPVMRMARRDVIRRHRITHSKRTPTPEQMYRDLIKAGMVRIDRRKGKPPAIVWL